MDDDEVKAERIAAMGPELGRLFHELANELFVLHDNWREYKALFYTSEKCVEVLIRAADRFFGILQQQLFEDMLLHLARLTSKRRSAGHDVLTLQRLPDLITSDQLRVAVQQDVGDAVAKTAFATDWRHNYIAHRSLKIALSDDPSGMLAPATGEAVEAALGSVARVLNRIHGHYLHSDFRFDIPGGPGDALELLTVLSLGVRARDDREQRFAAGHPLPEDLTRPDCP